MVRLGPISGALLIVANMIGVGVFTTTGYMASAIPSPPAILLAWLAGGVAALCGALTYAELGAAFPRNGGEYQLLSRLYHPALGFCAGWVSLVVGFSAPLALYAKAFGTYLEGVAPGVHPAAAGVTIILVLAAIHTLHVGMGSRFHDVATWGKVALILLFVAAGLLRGEPGRLTDTSAQSLGQALTSPLLAVQLVYVSFAYGGWNTTSYLAGEFVNPQRDIPRSVLAGTTLVTLLYVGLNAVFLMSAPLEELAGQERVGHVAAGRLFGEVGGKVVSLLIVAGLVSTMSANLMAGPRVYEAIGVDYPLLGMLRWRRANGGPIVAILLQAFLAITLLVTASFSQLLTYVSVTLSLFAALTVAGAMLLRYREPELPRPYRTWGYPLTPLVFLVLEGWMIVFAIQKEPFASFWSFCTISAGLLGYLLVRLLTTSSGAGR
ncbi:MAG: APC family permease [Planctomycetales bacterium]